MRFWKEADVAFAFKYARALTRHHSKSFYVSACMLPTEKRWATFAAYAFCRHVDNLVDLPRERSSRELLQEMTHLEEELCLGWRTGESEHPVLKSYLQTARQYEIPLEYALELIKGVKMDLEIERYETFEDLHLFCYRVAAVVGLIMTHILGYTSRDAFEYAESLGIAMQLTNILRDIREDARMGRIYLPLEEIRRFGCSESQILEERMTPGFTKLMRFQITRAETYYREAQPGISLLEADAQFGIFAASKIYRGILRRLVRQDFNPFAGRVYVPQSRKLAILLQELLRSRLGAGRRDASLAHPGRVKQ